MIVSLKTTNLYIMNKIIPQNICEYGTQPLAQSLSTNTKKILKFLVNINIKHLKHKTINIQSRYTHIQKKLVMEKNFHSKLVHSRNTKPMYLANATCVRS